MDLQLNMHSKFYILIKKFNENKINNVIMYIKPETEWSNYDQVETSE